MVLIIFFQNFLYCRAGKIIDRGEIGRTPVEAHIIYGFNNIYLFCGGVIALPHFPEIYFIYNVEQHQNVTPKSAVSYKWFIYFNKWFTKTN